MVLFIDSSRLDEIKYFMNWGVAAGVTTNPKIIATEGQATADGIKEQIQSICEVVDGSVSMEVLAMETDAMIAEGKEYYAWCPEKIAVKIPMCEPGIPAIRALSAEGIPVNVTCLMNSKQAYIAALSGARYVSLFFGRIKDLGFDPTEAIAQTRELIEREGLNAEIIAGSIRHPLDVMEAMSAGAHIVTAGPAIIKKMIYNPSTENTIKEFSDAWSDMVKRG